jgi:hypothetical protein
VPDPIATTPTDPSLSPPASPSPSPAAPAPSDESALTPKTPATRPSFVPETFWDPQASTVREKEFGDELNRLTAVDLENKARLAAVPPKPDEYKLVNTSEFKLPEDFAFEFDTSDPIYGELRTWAQQNGLSQPAFSGALDMLVKHKMSEHNFVKAESAKQVESLGANGPQRIDTIKTWLKARLGADAAAVIMERPVIAAEVEAYEKLMAQFSNVVPFNNQHRATPDNQPSQEDWSKLPHGERLALGRKLDAQKSPTGR